MHAGKQKQKNRPMSPPQKNLQDLDLQKLFCLWSQGLGLKCTLSPSTAPSPRMWNGLPAVWFLDTGIISIQPPLPKEIRHWWLPLLYLSSLFSFCEGSAGTQQAAAHAPQYSHVGSFFMAVDRSWGESNYDPKAHSWKKKPYKQSPTKITSTFFPHDHGEGALFLKT